MISVLCINITMAGFITYSADSRIYWFRIVGRKAKIKRREFTHLKELLRVIARRPQQANQAETADQWNSWVKKQTRWVRKIDS